MLCPCPTKMPPDFSIIRSLDSRLECSAKIRTQRTASPQNPVTATHTSSAGARVARSRFDELTNLMIKPDSRNEWFPCIKMLLWARPGALLKGSVKEILMRPELHFFIRGAIAELLFHWFCADGRHNAAFRGWDHLVRRHSVLWVITIQLRFVNVDM